MTRRYVKMTPEKRERLRLWYIAYLEIGTYKTIAKELGISAGRVEQLINQLRADMGFK